MGLKSKSRAAVIAPAKDAARRRLDDRMGFSPARPGVTNIGAEAPPGNHHCRNGHACGTLESAPSISQEKGQEVVRSSAFTRPLIANHKKRPPEGGTTNQ